MDKTRTTTNKPLPTNYFAKEEDYEFALTLAKLAAQTYSTKNNFVVDTVLRLVRGIDEIKQQSFVTAGYKRLETGGDRHDRLLGGADSGLDFVLFEHEATGNLVLAFRGTEPTSLKDWKNDIKQVLGNSEQYEKAVQLARSLVAKVHQEKEEAIKETEDKDKRNIQIAFTGHSLGGGLGMAAALATGMKAVVFDAAGISDRTMEVLQLDKTNQVVITNVNVRECFVSDWNKKMDATTLGTSPLTPCQQYGQQVWLKSVSKQADVFGIPEVLESTPESFLNHAWHVYTYQLENRNFDESMFDDGKNTTAKRSLDEAGVDDSPSDADTTTKVEESTTLKKAKTD